MLTGAAADAIYAEGVVGSVGWVEETARWPNECTNVGCTAATGVTREGFKALYIKFRQTDAAADLASCRANGH